MTGMDALNVVAEFIEMELGIPAEAVVGCVDCPEVEADHKESWRVHAHTLHHPATICLAKAFEDLADEHKIGIMLHEFGHIYGGPGEADADLWVSDELGIDIDYVETMQWVGVDVLTS